MPRRSPLLCLLLCCLLASCSLFRVRPPRYEAVVLDSGVTVRDLVVPDAGVEVALGDRVAVPYELRLADRSLAEPSRDNGIPLEFEVGSGTVPRGLEEGILGMRLFGRRRLSVPSALAFGSGGRPPAIPPDSDVQFDVELMEHVVAEP